MNHLIEQKLYKNNASLRTCSLQSFDIRRALQVYLTHEPKQHNHNDYHNGEFDICKDGDRYGSNHSQIDLSCV